MLLVVFFSCDIFTEVLSAQRQASDKPAIEHIKDLEGCEHLAQRNKTSGVELKFCFVFSFRFVLKCVVKHIKKKKGAGGSSS